MIEVLITLPFPEEIIAQLRGVSPKLHLTQLAVAKATDIPADVWARTEVLYTAQVLPAPEQAPLLRWIQFHYAGIDRLISEPLLKKEGLIVTTLSGAAAPQLAEHILAMILALGHHLADALVLQNKKQWPKDRFDRFRPIELRDATVGIVGYGSIGRQVARLLQPFGATVLAAKRNAMQPLDSGYSLEGTGDPEGVFVHRLYPAEALRSMLKESRFVVVAVPLAKNTKGLINDEMLNALPQGAFLIDVSRGGVVDHNALIAALKDGKLAGAALDVFPEEPLPAASPLWNMPNVIVTPHIAGNSPHYTARAATLFSENLYRYLSGLTLYNIFDFQREY
jgi:phosphoglycerate dehydrogenase-like enzyme